MVHVLVVEDDESISEVLAYQLTAAGYRPTVAADGVTALRRFREDAPDLVILDLMLPRLSGHEVLRAIRAHSDVAVIVLTALGSESDRVGGLDLGADDYVSKPFSMRELLARVNAQVRRARARREPAPAPEAPITIDVERHQVRRRGEPVALAPKEFELLAYLMAHAHKVCRRESILEAVWGYSFGGGTRTVDVHIRWLRQKLEDDPAHPRHLLTVRHYGYKFVP